MKIALITGSSRGIGAAIAKKLGDSDWKVLVHYTKDQSSAHETAEAIGESCLGVLQADLRDSDQTRGLWEAATQEFGVTALVNNAGIYVPGSFHADSEEWFDLRKTTFRVNFEAPSELIHYAIPYFLKQGGGKVLNVSSRVGFRGEANAAMYAASKAALTNLTRSLAVEYAEKGIGFFGIAPGWVQTAMSRDGMEDRLPDILATIPLGRMALPEDCASAASFLLSDDASYLSGQTIDINGASYFH